MQEVEAAPGLCVSCKFVPCGKQCSHPAEGCAGETGCPLLQYFNMGDQDTAGTILRCLLWKIQEFSK